jgi:predicted RNase H-like nuclease (RuvC/YqgF family)
MGDQQPIEVPNGENPEKMDRVRDIIFGPQMRDYEQRFKQTVRDLERLQQEIDHLTERLTEQDATQLKKLQALHREMRQSDDDIRTELRQTADKLTFDKVDRMALGELFIELGSHLKMGGSLAGLADWLTNLDEKAK